MFKTYSSSSSLVINSCWFATSRLAAPAYVRLVYFACSTQQNFCVSLMSAGRGCCRSPNVLFWYALRFWLNMVAIVIDGFNAYLISRVNVQSSLIEYTICLECIDIYNWCHFRLICKKLVNFIWCKTDSRFAPSQWETSLQSNAVSHWLGANQESALLSYCIIVYVLHALYIS